ncbi:MAG: tRNA (adenosine(37)-N6)-dimethylallyltransferase MiaA, partial [Oscillospiraceae bacterium]
KINEVIKNKKIPIIAGGTGLYISSLIDNIQFNEVKTDVKLRQELYDFAKINGANALWKKLFEIDEESALQIHENNIPRVARAIEIYKLTGVKMCQHKKNSKMVESEYNALKIGINYKNREILYDRINKRVEIMLEKGLIDEAKEILKDKNLVSENTAFQAIGYKELLPYFNGEISLQTAVNNIKQESRHYAKRQLTWFRRDENIKWFYPDDENKNENLQEMQKNIHFYIDNFFKMCYD